MAGEREQQQSTIGAQIAAGIAEGLQAITPPKMVKPGDPRWDPKTPFRSHKGPRLKGELYDNGFRCVDSQMTDAEINLANQITQSGRYVNRIVEVQVSADAGQRVVLIRYSNKDIDQRMALMAHWTTFEQLLSLIVKEQNAVKVA